MMKALELEAVGKLRLVDAPVPAPAPDQLVVRTRAALICTSDINDFRRNPFGINLPVVIGHEAAGTVAAIGREVKGFRIHDHVATHPVHPCGECANCSDGLAHLCSGMKHFGINMQGAFAEYFLVRQDRARVVPPDVRFTVAALAEPVSVCLEALRQARLADGDTLLVLGDGPFGVIIAWLASLMNLSKTVVAGHHDFRLSMIGAAVGMNSGKVDDVRAALLDQTRGRGYDAAILAVGNAKAVETGVECLRPGGRFVVFSALPGPTPVDLFSVHVKELEIVGACNDRDMFDRAVGLLSDERLDLERLVTHTFALEGFAEAFQTAETGHDKALKVAFAF